MDKNKIIRKPNRLVKGISIKIPLNASKWLREKNYSPTGIFMEALEDLGWKYDKKN